MRMISDCFEEGAGRAEDKFGWNGSRGPDVKCHHEVTPEAGAISKKLRVLPPGVPRTPVSLIRSLFELLFRTWQSNRDGCRSE